LKTGIYEQIAANKWKSALLVSLFMAVVVALGFFVGYLFSYRSGSLGGAVTGLIIASVIAVIMALVSYYKSDSAALMMSGAREITREEYPYLVNTVEGLAIAAGLPAPRVYVIDTDAMNAFATGRDPQHASIAVTRGLLERCNRLELEGVIAHEMSHIKNYDIRLMCMVVVLVGFVVIASELFLRMFIWGGIGGGRRRSGDGGGEGGIIYLALLVIGLVFLILSPIFAQLLQLSISRRREYLADASGAMLTRYPEGLASALEKLTVEARPFPHASKATAHLFIVQPFRKEGMQKHPERSSIWDTHPPVMERIRRLRAMASMDGMYNQAMMEARLRG
jgi:heat shock protein HtpX